MKYWKLKQNSQQLMEQITSQTIYTVFDADRTSYVIPITIQTDHVCQLNDLFVHKCPYVVI